MQQTLQDIWFYAFIITAIILGYIWGRLRSKFMPLYEIIAGLRLESDTQARTIEHQRRVIAELEKEDIRAFRGAFKSQEDKGQ